MSKWVSSGANFASYTVGNFSDADQSITLSKNFETLRLRLQDAHIFVHYPAAHGSSETVNGRGVGTLGFPFVTEPRVILLPHLDAPQELRGTNEVWTLRVAVAVDKTGKVMGFQILEAQPKMKVEKAVAPFFRQILFEEYKPVNEPIQYETEMILIIRPSIQGNQELVPTITSVAAHL